MKIILIALYIIMSVLTLALGVYCASKGFKYAYEVKDEVKFNYFVWLFVVPLEQIAIAILWPIAIPFNIIRNIINKDLIDDICITIL